METITVYSKPNCVQCTATYRALTTRGIEYTIVDVTESAAALAYVTEELGYSAAPVVVVDDENHWSGFRPDKIAQIETDHRDVSQGYNGSDFVTVCSCGAEFEGSDPDDANAKAFDHCNPEGGQK